MEPTKTTIDSFQEEKKTSTGKYEYVPRTKDNIEVHEHKGVLGVGYTVYEFGVDKNGNKQRRATGHGFYSETFDWTPWEGPILKAQKESIAIK